MGKEPNMKHFKRFLLFAAALAVGGGLGYLLLPAGEPLQAVIFLAACGLLGGLFHRIDKWICETPEK